MALFYVKPDKVSHLEDFFTKTLFSKQRKISSLFETEIKKGFSTSEKALIRSRVNKFY